MKVSVIIPVINEAEIIDQAIERAWLAGADEVIIADGGSQDATLQRCRQAPCRLVQSTAGRGVQLNAGAAVATGDVLLFLHADNWLAGGSCDQIRARLKTSGGRFGGFVQRIENPRRIYRWIEWGNQQRIRFRGLVYGDQGMFVCAATFSKAGGFPPIPIMEDLALSRTLKRQGRPLILEGPTMVSSRRWEQTGPIRQTVRNWRLSSAFLLGAPAERLARQYHRHDQPDRRREQHRD